MQKVTNQPVPINKIEQQTYDKMWDSEYLAHIMAVVVKNNPEALTDYAFERIDKILTELSKMEMN